MYFQKHSIGALAFLSLLVFGCAPPVPAAAAAIDDNSVPPGWVKVGDLKPTFYWVAMETNDGGAKVKELKDIDGNVIARISNKFYTEIRMEGTGKMLDGRVINFHVRVNGDIRWRVCPPEAPYGYGIEDYVLTPFRSVAVDPNVVPIPSKIFIPAAKGTPLPDGSIHDGIFDAVDIGSAIQNQRIDIFTSFGDQSQVFIRHGISNMKPIAVYRMPPESL